MAAGGNCFNSGGQELWSKWEKASRNFYFPQHTNLLSCIKVPFYSYFQTFIFTSWTANSVHFHKRVYSISKMRTDGLLLTLSLQGSQQKVVLSEVGGVVINLGKILMPFVTS